MTITELMYYGRYYRDEDNANILWWYDTHKDRVCLYEDLLKQFGYKTSEDIINSEIFIPLFQTDIISLQQKFISKMRNKKIAKYFTNISECDFSREFNMFIERDYLTDSWYNFEKKHLYEDALEWCRNNNIEGVKH